MILILCALTSLLLTVFLLSPFLLGPGGSLLPSSTIDSEEILEGMKKNILLSYLKYETLFNQKLLNKKEWDQRQNFLTNRYLDVTRRLDWLRFQRKKGDL